ncbi:tetratricopeptide repeat-containing sulfotransferase family protein [Roseivivax sediminis]|uniref:Sulfotransferase family protein n=1 Tax=Roseivivax sediminis TaxID=936889 RepID=A0A1I1ZK82_9RHOB|nr:sulfotransferase [Roseivivax sediminis]SFE32107.1 Sulfotransferase family protein [Roseivivax sediminis]
MRQTARPQQSPSERYKAALAAIEAGRHAEARAALTQLGMERPRAPEIPYQLSRIAGFAADLPARLRQIDRALALRPEDPALIDAAIAAHDVAGDAEAALALHDRRIAAAKNRLHAETAKAVYLQHVGRFDAAETLLRDLIARHPREGVLYRTLFATLKISPDEPLLPRLETLLARRDMADNSRADAHFAMAKAREDIGDTAAVFPHLDIANRLQRAAAPYDPAAQAREHDGLFAAQKDADLAPVPGSPAPRPVFVIGPPRAGTTLAERILAGHAGVTAGGELAHALRLVASGFNRGGALAPLDGVTQGALQALARRYLDQVRFDTGAAGGVVTDKSIQSHLVLGYLARALPEARFVSVRRDPRDTALSIYKTHFRTGTHRYSNALADIALALKTQRAIMAHWRDRLPDRVTEIAYEDLVSDPEPAARALAAAAGLDFAPESLDTTRPGRVRTLSVAQARQPIHAGRRAAWRAYETELQPFLDAWGDDPWD